MTNTTENATSWERWAWTMVRMAEAGEPTATGALVSDDTLREIRAIAYSERNWRLHSAAHAALA